MGYQYLWKIDRWNGGESDDSRIGLAGAFRSGSIGNDIYKDSGLLSVAHKPVEHSANSVTKLVKWIEPHPTNGKVYYYAEDTIYEEFGGVTSVVRALGDSANGQGLCDFDGHLYYRSATQLGRFDYVSTWTDAYKTGLTSTSTFAPLFRYKNLLVGASGRYMFSLDDIGTWNAQRLTLPPGYNIRDFERAGSLLVIAAMRGNQVSDSDEGMLFFWDGNSQSYIDFQPIDGNPHALCVRKNKIFVIAGDSPSIQISLGGPTEIIQEIPEVGDGYTAEVYPGAIDSWNRKIHFGISAGTSPTVVRCVRAWGGKSGKFPDVLNPLYPTSQGNLTGTTIQITALKKIGGTIRFAWKDGSTYGVDSVDTSQYLSESIYRSLAFDRLSPHEKVANRLLIELAKELATGESVTVKISPDPYGDPSFADATSYESMTESTVGKRVVEFPLVQTDNPIRSRDLHLEIRLAGTGSTRPQAKRAWTAFEEEDDQL